MPRHDPRASAGFDALLTLTPEPAATRHEAAAAIDALWPALVAAAPALAPLAECPQDPTHHGEGDVAIHTRMVLAELIAASDFAARPPDERGLLFWAAVLHDVGKPASTRDEDGRLTARGHSRVGASMARRFLWERGAPPLLRERLAALIAHHQAPFWLIERDRPERLAIAIGETLHPPDLIAHARADGRGRIAADQDALLERIDLAEALFEEFHLDAAPWPFATAESRVAWAERDDRDPHFAAPLAPVMGLAQNTPVTLLAGLPGAGKDRWIAEAGADRPVVSLDAIRRRLGVAPSDPQGAVVQAAYEEAKTHLRAGREFIWNATNVTRALRAKPLALLRDYGAEIEIVYIEVGPSALIQQNRDPERGARGGPVPEAVLTKMLNAFEPPQPTEAHTVRWIVDGAPIDVAPARFRPAP